LSIADSIRIAELIDCFLADETVYNVSHRFQMPQNVTVPLIHRLKAGSVMEQSHGFLFHFLLIWKRIAAFLRQFVFEECNTS
ncbi:hypothetical protein CEXT_292751, partial [Caerostris extrusa]